MKLTQSALDKVIQQSFSSGSLHGCVFQVQSPGENINRQSAAGNLSPESAFYVASINKIFLSALAFRLRQNAKLDFNNTIAEYLPEYFTDALLVYKGTDYSKDIQVSHLISHTSGLPCYLIDKQPDGKKNMKRILAGEELAWPMEKMIAEVKVMKTHFPPGTKGKAAYSETNFRLLGRILEKVTGKPVHELLQALFDELGMKNTFVLSSENASQCTPVYHGNEHLHLEKYWDASHHDVASTTTDLMIFLKAFFGGRFFPQSKLESLKNWNNIFFPFKYGIGIQKFYIPRILSPFHAIPEIIGHCGSVGSIAFFIPEKDVFITGSINQAGRQQKAFQVMMRIINLV